MRFLQYLSQSMESEYFQNQEQPYIPETLANTFGYINQEFVAPTPGFYQPPSHGELVDDVISDTESGFSSQMTSSATFSEDGQFSI